VFATFGFVGMCFLYLAFCEALPDGDRRLYRLLLFLTPTLWFWPSSVGKEAFLLLCIGATAYGFARLIRGHLLGALLTGLGLWGAAVVRPHIALMLLIGMVAALPPTFGRRARVGDPRQRRPLASVLLPLLVLLALPALLGAVERFFDITGLNVDSAIEVRDEVARRTSGGGSEFTPPDTSNPIGLLQGLATVVARPFPWEASGFQALASAEIVLLGTILVVAAARRGKALVRALAQRWPRFALAYVLAFAWAFSVVSNFGILARQRSLMMPLLFVLFAAAKRPVPSEAADDRTSSVQSPNRVAA
jgi:hypothetical protein